MTAGRGQTNQGSHQAGRDDFRILYAAAGWLWSRSALGNALILVFLSAAPLLADAGAGDEPSCRAFSVKGVVKELQAENRTVVVGHENIPGYMSAMIMPFKVRDAKELAGLRAGDEISFRLNVSDSESWLDSIRKTRQAPLAEAQPVLSSLMSTEGRSSPPRHPLLDYYFTNELGQAVSIADFRGQALAVTFFFTRCPIPEYCPRLSRNFEQASQKLSSLADAPTNWHFLSVTFDPAYDTPAVLKAYGERYHYDQKHWSFLTGAKDKVGEFTRLSGVEFEADGGWFNHSFRTLIISASGQLQTSFPVSGNLSDAIVSEILRAAAVTNLPIATPGPELGGSR
jgi:protein SCO1/2